ncbi:MAG: hypothetical protein EAY75_09540 [Bacteroidetes bacterium]|nr:MAG: hypothetical protein EAY75_09540 [Bacteroidota bacterium]
MFFLVNSNILIDVRRVLSSNFRKYDGVNRWVLLTLSVVGTICACSSKGPKVPSVEGFTAVTVVQRFDRDFFALDTNRLEPALDLLQQKYPEFLGGFLATILGVNPTSPDALLAIKAFIGSYGQLQQQVEQSVAPTIPKLQTQVALGLKLMQYYCPGYRPDSPFVLTTFVGPMDAYEPFATGDYGEVATANGAGVALQLHLGAKAAVYEQGVKSGAMYSYQIRRFTPETMVVNVMKNVVNEAFPYPNNNSLNLVEEMVEKGKHLYLLQRLLPYTPDSLLLGYTHAQWQGCEANEALIWNFFVKNDLLYASEPQITQNYLKDGPKTPELGEGAPGYIGLFVGKKIVEAYMAKFADTPVPKLMRLPAAQLFQAAGYKP